MVAGAIVRVEHGILAALRELRRWRTVCGCVVLYRSSSIWRAIRLARRRNSCNNTGRLDDLHQSAH